MKALLACLMCLVLTLSQAFAISGGPFGGKKHVLVTGTYAGVFVPAIDPGTGMADPNSLAIFTLRIPQIGSATGTAAIFRNGFFYPGTIVGSADPASARVSGIIQGQFDDIIISGPTSLINHYYSSGQFVSVKIDAKSGALSLSSVRLKGSATISYVPGSGFTPDPRGDSGGPIPYRVKGFKQSFGTE